MGFCLSWVLFCCGWAGVFVCFCVWFYFVGLGGFWFVRFVVFLGWLFRVGGCFDLSFWLYWLLLGVCLVGCLLCVVVVGVGVGFFNLVGFLGFLFVVGFFL